jgi:hypothetical protein
MVKFDELRCMDLIGVFPSVVAFGVALPFDQILQGFEPPPGPMRTYLLHFILLFSINQIWWRSGEVGSVCLCFSVSGDETVMENWVDVPSRG